MKQAAGSSGCIHGVPVFLTVNSQRVQRSGNTGILGYTGLNTTAWESISVMGCQSVGKVAEIGISVVKKGESSGIKTLISGTCLCLHTGEIRCRTGVKTGQKVSSRFGMETFGIQYETGTEEMGTGGDQIFGLKAGKKLTVVGSLSRCLKRVKTHCRKGYKQGQEITCRIEIDATRNKQFGRDVCLSGNWRVSVYCDITCGMCGYLQ